MEREKRETGEPENREQEKRRTGNRETGNRGSRRTGDRRTWKQENTGRRTGKRRTEGNNLIKPNNPPKCNPAKQGQPNQTSKPSPTR